MQRRDLLALVTGLGASVAGCLGERDGSPTPQPTGTGTGTAFPDRTVTPASANAVTAVPDCGGQTGGAYWVDATPVAEAGSTPIRYGDLPRRERVIVRTAIGPKTWATCEEREAFFGFRDRVMAHRGEVDGETVFLRYRGSPYCLDVRATDLVISSCPPP